jgi:hypothetical protein
VECNLVENVCVFAVAVGAVVAWTFYDERIDNLSSIYNIDRYSVLKLWNCN